MADSTPNGFNQIILEYHGISRYNLLAELDFLDLKEIGDIIFRVRNEVQNKNATCLGHGFYQKNTRHYRFIWKMANKKGFIHRDILHPDHMMIA